MTKSTLSAAPMCLWRLVAGTKLRRNIMETYGTRVLVAAVGFATTIVIARALGPAGRGLFAVAITIGAIGVQFSSLGLHASNMYYVAKDRALLPALIGNMLAVVLVTAALMVVGGVGFVIWPNLSPIHGTLLVLAIALIPAGLAYLLTQGLLLGIDEVRTYNELECVGKTLILALICIAVFVNRGTVELFLAVSLSSTILTFLWALLRLRRVSSTRPVLSWVVFRQSIGIGVRAYTIAFFGFLLLRIDLLMVKYMLGATEAGYYSITQVLAENTMMFPVIVGLLLFPKLSANQSREEKVQLTNKAVLATAALMLPVVVIAALAAGQVISIAFGAKFLPAVLPFIWLMPGTYFLGLETVMVQILNSDGYPPVVILTWIAATILNVALNFWAIPRYGILGASVLSSICYFLVFVLVCAVVWKRFYARYPVTYAPQPEPM